MSAELSTRPPPRRAGTLAPRGAVPGARIDAAPGLAASPASSSAGAAHRAAARGHLTAAPEPRIPASALERIGRAPWVSDSQAQAAYGASLHARSRELGKGLADGSIASYQDLWTRCRAWRCEMLPAAAEGDTQAAATAKAFGEARQGESFTGTGGKYSQVQDAVWRRHDEATTDAMAARRMGAEGMHFSNAAIIVKSPEETQVTLPTKVLSQTAMLDGKPIPLTSVHVHEFPGSDAACQGSSGRMVHTSPEHLEAIDRHLGQLFEQALGADMANDTAGRMALLAEMHWFMAHAMPDERGSAAKSELAIRSMAMAMNLELPPFGAHVAPDLKAFVTTLADFKRAYVYTPPEAPYAVQEPPAPQWPRPPREESYFETFDTYNGRQYDIENPDDDL